MLVPLGKDEKRWWVAKEILDSVGADDVELLRRGRISNSWNLKLKKVLFEE